MSLFPAVDVLMPIEIDCSGVAVARRPIAIAADPAAEALAPIANENGTDAAPAVVDEPMEILPPAPPVPGVIALGPKHISLDPDGIVDMPIPMLCVDETVAALPIAIDEFAVDDDIDPMAILYGVEAAPAVAPSPMAILLPFPPVPTVKERDPNTISRSSTAVVRFPIAIPWADVLATVAPFPTATALDGDVAVDPTATPVLFAVAEAPTATPLAPALLDVPIATAFVPNAATLFILTVPSAKFSACPALIIALFAPDVLPAANTSAHLIPSPLGAVRVKPPLVCTWGIKPVVAVD